MPDVYTIHQVSEATKVTRRQIDIWKSRGYLHLDDNPPSGEARNFTFIDALNIAVMETMGNFGIPANRFWGGVSGLPGFYSSADLGVLLVWKAEKQPYGVLEPMLDAKICRHEDLSTELKNGEKVGVVIVDLRALEKQLLASLEASGGSQPGELRAMVAEDLNSEKVRKEIYDRFNTANTGKGE